MKKFAVIFFFSLAFIGCKKDSVEKPERLLSQQEMENILYDIAIVQAMHAYAPRTLEENDLTESKYIYEKYKIDSTTFIQNHNYYASNPEVYKKIQEKITERLNKEKKALDTEIKKEEAKKPKPQKAVYNNPTLNKNAAAVKQNSGK